MKVRIWYTGEFLVNGHLKWGLTTAVWDTELPNVWEMAPGSQVVKIEVA